MLLVPTGQCGQNTITTKLIRCGSSKPTPGCSQVQDLLLHLGFIPVHVVLCVNMTRPLLLEKSTRRWQLSYSHTSIYMLSLVYIETQHMEVHESMTSYMLSIKNLLVGYYSNCNAKQLVPFNVYSFQEYIDNTDMATSYYVGTDLEICLILILTVIYNYDGHMAQMYLNVDWTEDSSSVAACIITVKINLYLRDRHFYVVASVRRVQRCCCKTKYTIGQVVNKCILSSGQPLGLLFTIAILYIGNSKPAVCYRFPHHSKKHTVASPVATRERKQGAKVMCSGHGPAHLLCLVTYTQHLVCRAGLDQEHTQTVCLYVKGAVAMISTHAFGQVCHSH